MNRTMVKRGIGAAALAIVAALLLGYLLKGKDQERQDVVDMTLPGAQEVQQSLNIPALKGADGKQNMGDAADNAGETVVAAADAAGNKAVQANPNIKTQSIGVNTVQNKGDDLDFTVRPPKGEKRVIVDNIGKDKQQSAPETVNNTAAANATQNSGAISRPSEGTVVASSEPTQNTYRPRLIGERERKPSYGIVAAESSSASQQAASQKPVQQAKPQTPATANGYAVQLLATSSSSRANGLKNTMRKEGYNCVVSKTSQNGKVLFRVRVVGYANRQAAISAQSAMKRRYQKNQFVKSSLVVAN